MSRLVKNSYMDTTISSDIKITNYNYSLENLEKLKLFYSLSQKEIKWIKKIKIKDKNNYLDLLNYYKKLNNCKIKRLNNNKQSMLSKEEYGKYLKNLRIYDEKNFINNLSLKRKEKFNPLLRRLMKLSTQLSGIEIVKLNEQLPDTNGRPIIFVLTHVGKDDISVFSSVIKEHYTILSGDYESLHNNIEGLIMLFNGVKFFDMKSSNDRKNISSVIETVLNDGDNILCSMEAAWNITPNELVTKLFPGMIKVGINTNAVIVPVGIERFNGKLYGVNVSNKVFDPKKYIDDDIKYSQATEDLRQLMADIKYQIYLDERITEKIKCSRKEIGDYYEYNEKFKQDVLNGWTFTEESIDEKKYHDLEKPIYAYNYISKLFSNKLEILKKQYVESKEIDKSEINKLIYIQMCELLKEMKNPIYPDSVLSSLKQIYNEYLSIFDIQYEQKEKIKKI